MLIPDFITSNPSERGREMVTLSEINVARDILDLKFISNSEEGPS